MLKVIGIPYEGPENFIKGTALAPSRIRWAMDSIEDYSIYQKELLPDYKDCGDIYAGYHEEPEKAIFEIKEKLKFHMLNPEERYVILGGDHSITLPVVMALK